MSASEPPAPREAISVRSATPGDVDAIKRFGAEVIPAHYAPLIGQDAARSQVEQWWDAATTTAAVAASVIVVADLEGQIVGVGQRGRMDGEHVVWKLYVHPSHRGQGLGPRLLGALTAQLPSDAEYLWIEHFAANVRAGAFYEREGFSVDHRVASPTGTEAMDQVWRVRPLTHP